MFIPNTSGFLHKRKGRSVHGKTQFLAPVLIELAVVNLGVSTEDSEVRADQSASRASAEITALKAKLLLPASVTVSRGDVIQVAGQLVEVSGITPRIHVAGDVDHYEVDGNLKGEL